MLFSKSRSFHLNYILEPLGEPWLGIKRFPQCTSPSAVLTPLCCAALQSLATCDGVFAGQGGAGPWLWHLHMVEVFADRVDKVAPSGFKCHMPVIPAFWEAGRQED